MPRSLSIALGSALLGVALVTSSTLAQEPPLCGPEIKLEVAKSLAALASDEKSSPNTLAMEAELYQKFSYCAQDTHSARPRDTYCGQLVYSGSTYYESMPCCGYDPQKRQFACPVEVRQPVGFGAAHFPGSNEYVLTCVDFGGGFQQVALDDVHLADEIHGARPNWYFAVIARASGELANMSLKGQTFMARSILSWGLRPDGCKYTPIWGNVIDYQIRLDP